MQFYIQILSVSHSFTPHHLRIFLRYSVYIIHQTIMPWWWNGHFFDISWVKVQSHIPIHLKFCTCAAGPKKSWGVDEKMKGSIASFIFLFVFMQKTRGTPKGTCWHDSGGRNQFISLHTKIERSPPFDFLFRDNCSFISSYENKADFFLKIIRRFSTVDHFGPQSFQNEIDLLKNNLTC